MIRDGDAFALQWKALCRSTAIHRLNIFNGHIAKVSELPKYFFKGVYMIKGRFAIDDGPVYEGYHICGQYWNGWEMPYFTRDVAERILKDGPDETPEDEGGYAGYTFPLEDAKDIVDLENPIKVLTVWGIGAGGWCWDLVEPTEQVDTPPHPHSPLWGSRPDNFTDDQYNIYMQTAEKTLDLIYCKNENEDEAGD
jgi:hypothetical protein